MRKGCFTIILEVKSKANSEIRSFNELFESLDDNELKRQLQSYKENLDRLERDIEKSTKYAPYGLQQLVTTRNQIEARIREIEIEMENRNER